MNGDTIAKNVWKTFSRSAAFLLFLRMLLVEPYRSHAGLLRKLGDDSTVPLQTKETKQVEMIAMEAVMAVERKLGFVLARGGRHSAVTTLVS
jgi:hypothetical protein